jgi:hypothetical protein
VLDRHARMQVQVREQSLQLDDRRASNEMARIAAFNARERYIDVLRATVRRYKKNVQELGELAGVIAQAELPHLDNDDTGAGAGRPAGQVQLRRQGRSRPERRRGFRRPAGAEELILLVA